MPKPTAGEALQDFVDHCIPQVMDEGVTDPSGEHRTVTDPKEAYAICRSMYDRGEKEIPVVGTLHTEHVLQPGTKLNMRVEPTANGLKHTILSANGKPLPELCLAQACSTPATWQLAVSDRHLHYCDDCLEGAVKALKRHDLKLDDCKSLKEAQTGVILALKPDPELAERLTVTEPAVDALSAKDLHVTLLYLGTVDALTQDHKQERLIRAVEGIADRIAPFHAKLNGVTRFTETHSGKHALVLNVDSPALPDLRQRLVDTLHNIGYDCDDTHGFTPHVTLAYIGENDPLPPHSLPEEPIVFDTLYVFWGDEHIPAPLNTELYEKDEHGLKGSWVTIEEKPIFVGGPSQGGGGGTGGTGLPKYGTDDLEWGSGADASSKVFSFSGTLYRAENADTQTKVALGPATYLTHDPEVASEFYGSDVRSYHASLDRVLGTNSPEYDSLRRQALHLWNTDDAVAASYKHPVFVINQLARDAGYDAFWAGPVFGMAVFDRDALVEQGGEWKKGAWVTIEEKPVFIGGPSQGGGGSSSVVGTMPEAKMPAEAYKGMSDPLKKKVAEWEAKYTVHDQGGEKEAGMMYDQDGKMIGPLVDCTESQARIPEEYPAKDAVLTHYHPPVAGVYKRDAYGDYKLEFSKQRGMSTTLSPTDLVAASELDLAEVRAVGISGVKGSLRNVIYIARRPPDGWPPPKDIKAFTVKSRGPAIREIGELRSARDLAPWSNAVHHTMWEDLEVEFGIEYEVHAW